MYYVLFYELIDNAVELRAPFREAHLGKIDEAHAAGQLLVTGWEVRPWTVVTPDV